jgi:hypothetical protein
MEINWNTIAAIGQAVAAMASVAGLIFVGVQLKASVRASDREALLEFFRDITAGEAALLKSDDADKVRHFNEYLNLLEAYATAANKGLLPRTSLTTVVDKICESLAVIEAHGWKTQMDAAITSETTFSELSAFRKRHRKKIDGIATALGKSPIAGT